jgi:Ca2+-binding RTX toxin-like protein
VGGGGVDVINYAESGSAVEVSLLSGKASSWGAFSSGVRFVDKLQSIENVVGSKFDDSIFGDSRANVLDGKSGKDVLNGFRGRDQLAGGDDSDLFVFSKTSDTGLGTKADVITDFSSAEGDKIDLSSIDAKRGFTRNDSFTFSDSQPISPGSAALGTVWFVQDTSPLQGSLGGFLLGSTDNDVAPEFAIRVEFKGGQTLISASDVVL